MALGNRLTRWGTVRLSRRVSRSLPILGAAIAAATVVATMRRKGMLSGALDTGLNAMPGIGAAKNAIEFIRGKDFFPDRPRTIAVRGTNASSTALSNRSRGRSQLNNY